MIADGGYIDGSWQLCVYVEDIQKEHQIRVKGDLHIGGVMHRVVEAIEIKQDWSDHALWWPEQNRWLLHTRTTLDQYGVQSDAKLIFMHMHNNIQILLPSLAPAVIRVNFSANVLSVVIRVCKELSIRQPEELSFCFPVTKEHLLSNCPLPTIRHGTRRQGQTATTPQPKVQTPEIPAACPISSPMSSNIPISAFSPDGAGPQGFLAVPNPYPTLLNGSSTLQIQSHNSLVFDGFDASRYAECTKLSAKAVFGDNWVLRPKSLAQKARLNSTWLDSSRSLMEHGIAPSPSVPIALDSTKPPMINLRFKYYTFYDLNQKYDAVRIHQLYEQSRWSLLSGQIECTEDEMVVFAALQLQAELQTANPQQRPVSTPVSSSAVDTPDAASVSLNQPARQGIDEVDDMLAELEETCVGKPVSSVPADTTVIPVLDGYMKIFREKMFHLKNYRKFWTVVKETRLLLYKSSEDKSNVLEEFPLRDCVVTPDVNLSTNKFIIRLSLTVGDSKEELWIQSDNADEYSKWSAAFRLTSRGKTLASKAAYEKEVDSILEVLRLQAPGPQPVLSPVEISSHLKDLSDYCSERTIKKSKSKDYLRHRIAESHANLREYSILEAKLKYIKAWQGLTKHGHSYFIVLFDDKKKEKEEIIAITHNRMELVHPKTGDVQKTWHFTEMKSWNVNWDLEKVILDFKDSRVSFKPLSANCKTVIEFIGGYVFLSQRTPERNQELKEKLFHRLTGVSD